MADATNQSADVLAAADVYVGLTTDRADRPAHTAEVSAAELGQLVANGVLAAETTEAVLTAAGHQPSPPAKKPQYPAGLTGREVEVLCLAARGLTTKEIGEQLHISPKTADHHIQHVYAKIDVSTRAAAALWAMQNSLVA